MNARVRMLSVFVWAVCLVAGFFYLFLDCASVRAATPDLTGTYLADDGSVYFLQQDGMDLWWAGFSLDPGVPNDQIFHRGIAFTNVFKGVVQKDKISGDWIEVPRGASLNSGTVTLKVSSTPTAPGSGYQLDVLTKTGALTASRLVPSTAIRDDPDIQSRFVQVVKSANPKSLHANGLNPYRDETVFYGRVLGLNINGGVKNDVPNFLDTNGDRSYKSFISDHDNDHDLGINFALTGKETYFLTLGWGDTDFGVISSKLSDTTAYGAAKLLPGDEGFVHAEGLMYGHTAKDGAPDSGRVLFPGWADKGGNSILLNGRPINANDSPDNLKAYQEGLVINGVPVIAGSQIRITGVLTLDCGHWDWSSFSDNCYIGPYYRYSDDNRSQNQEIHPIYSIDVIRPPLGTGAGNARKNLTGVWGDPATGGTSYVRQIGGKIWILDLTRTRAPLQPGTRSPQIPGGASVFEGTISDNVDGSATITGVGVGVPYGSLTGSRSVSETMHVDANRKAIKIGANEIPLEKLYEPEDTSPPTSVANVSAGAVSSQPSGSHLPGGISHLGTPQIAKTVTIHATDQGSGVQNLWYRYYTNANAPLPAYTFVAGPDVTFTLQGWSDGYRVDFYATDNAGNDETARSISVSFITLHP